MYFCTSNFTKVEKVNLLMINNTKEMTRKLLLFASLLLIIACGDKKEKEIAAIPM